jgi:hypothetical protein
LQSCDKQHDHAQAVHTEAQTVQASRLTHDESVREKVVEVNAVCGVAAQKLVQELRFGWKACHVWKEYGASDN